MRKRVVQLYIKSNEVLFSLAWNIIFSDKFKVLVLNFLEIKDMVFLSQKFDRNMIFTDYWKVLVSTLSEMGNTVFSWAKKLTEIWYLLITERSCFNLFGNGKYGLFLSQKVDGNMIFTDYWKVLILNFSVIGNTVFFWVKKFMERWYLLVIGKFLFWTFRWWEIRFFFQPKSWWKDNSYVVFLSFLWYSRT